ncbi:hypothetical protein PYCCODRAFT_1364894 [Trametes coccinea BRFM310]|uniref:C2H2-type domain-containing protein n=1 Tax=Trametes coccinea (strain BRFM310) TaxID=1353009 RepID=A0A1Y2ISR5_TRAC3|nr:hypothetical protein PYCCODRAFT_1364894 [Trametes coccinea BRFM310]
MHNMSSPADHMFKTPQAPAHAPNTPPGFSLGFSPYEHVVYLQSAPYNYSALLGAPAQSGYLYASASCTAPPAVCPAAPPHHGGYQPIAQGQNSLIEPEEPTMTNSPIYASGLQPSITVSPSGGNGSNSDGGIEAMPPSSQERPRDVNNKRHHCCMCHKTFDRPSTLKKHLLVHTGEKAFACEDCGRRFSVVSSLHRHAKTCRAVANSRLARTHGASSSSPVAPTSQLAVSSPTSRDKSMAVVTPAAPMDSSGSAETPAPRRSTHKRKALSTEGLNTSDMASRPQKQARRAPAPVLWVPDSLKRFDLTPSTESALVPLPPVRPFQGSNQVEERDSFDKNASVMPYHPRGWKGRLPGPGLLGDNVTDRTRSGGQVLIF